MENHLLGGTEGRHRAREKTVDVLAWLRLWGITDTQIVGRVLGLRRSAASATVARGIAGFKVGYRTRHQEPERYPTWRRLTTTSAPGGILIANPAAAWAFCDQLMDRGCFDRAPPVTRASAVKPGQVAHDLISQHAALIVAEGAVPGWRFSAADVGLAQELIDRCGTDNSIPDLRALSAAIPSPVFLSDLILRSLGLYIGYGVSGLRASYADAVVLLPPPGGRDTGGRTIAIEVQESDQGIARDIGKMSVYATAVRRSQVDGMVIASTSSAIIDRARTMRDRIAAGQVIRRSWANGKWIPHPRKALIEPETADAIQVLDLSHLRRSYYVGLR